MMICEGIKTCKARPYLIDEGDEYCPHAGLHEECNNYEKDCYYKCITEFEFAMKEALENDLDKKHQNK